MKELLSGGVRLYKSTKVNDQEVGSFIDNLTFRLHYRTTFNILMVASILTTMQQYVGAPILCYAKGVPTDLMNTFCWIHGTFTVPAKLAGHAGENMPHQGIGPTTDPNLIRVTEQGEEIRHSWYQWVCFVLFLQALVFYVPHYLWKSWEGGKLKMMMQDLYEQKLDQNDGLPEDDETGNEGENGNEISDKTRKGRRLATVRYFLRKKDTNQCYVAMYVFCEILNLANVIAQMFFMNYFLGGQFFDYGLDVLRVTELPMEERIDPLSKVFPKVTKCTFNNYGPSGTVENKDGLCVLAINIINEKIYIFLWFWFMMIGVLTAIQIFIRFLSIVSPCFRLRLYFRLLELRAVMWWRDQKEMKELSDSNPKNEGNTSDLSVVVRNCAYGDFFLIMQFSKHFDPYVFHEFIIDIRDRLIKDKRDGREMQDWKLCTKEVFRSISRELSQKQNIVG